MAIKPHRLRGMRGGLKAATPMDSAKEVSTVIWTPVNLEPWATLTALRDT